MDCGLRIGDCGFGEAGIEDEHEHDEEDQIGIKGNRRGCWWIYPDIVWLPPDVLARSVLWRDCAGQWRNRGRCAKRLGIASWRWSGRRRLRGRSRDRCDVRRFQAGE